MKATVEVVTGSDDTLLVLTSAGPAYVMVTVLSLFLGLSRGTPSSKPWMTMSSYWNLWWWLAIPHDFRKPDRSWTWLFYGQLMGIWPTWRFNQQRWWFFRVTLPNNGGYPKWGISIPKGRLKTVRMPLLYSCSCFGEECCLKWFSNVLKMFNPWISVKFSQKLMMPTWLLTAWLGQRVEHRTWPRFLVPVVATLYGWFMGIAHFIDSRWEEKRESLWWSNLPKSTTISQV